MSILKGFGQITTLIDNTANTTSTVGEISADSKTFVQDYLTFTHGDWVGVELLSMQFLDDDLQEATPVSSQTQACLELITWVHTKALSGEIGPSKNTFVQLFGGEFAGRFTLLTSGDHVQHGTNWYPASISVCPEGREAEDNWTIWLADGAFSNEFDVSKIFVIPPIDNLDQFFNNPATVQSLVNAVSRTDVMNKVYNVRGESPYTVLRMDPFDWVYPTDTAVTVETYWTVVIYGRAGDNLDRVKEAIINHVMSNTARTVEEWSEIFPDIFKSTELIIAPSYYIQGVPDQQFRRGVYSAISSYRDSLELMKLVAKGTGYNNTHVEDTMTNLPSLYRGVSLTLVPGPENRVGYRNFRDIYRDYLNVPSTHPDFMLMTDTTRTFVDLLTDMLDKAEDMTPSTVIPAGYNRVERGGIWYLTKTNDDLLILVVSKYSVMQFANQLDLPTDLQ